MSLFDHGEPEEFLLFVQIFQMILADTGTLEMEANVQCLCALVRGEALHQFDLVSSNAKNSETLLDVDYLLKGLACFFFFVNSLLKQKRAMRRCMKNARSLKLRRYAACLVDLNEYLASFLGATMADKMVITELNKFLLNSMPDRSSKQVYVQGFDCGNIYFKRSVKMSECMEITESI